MMMMMMVKLSPEKGVGSNLHIHKGSHGIAHNIYNSHKSLHTIRLLFFDVIKREQSSSCHRDTNLGTQLVLPAINLYWRVL